MVVMHNANWFLDLMLLLVLTKSLVESCGATYRATDAELSTCLGLISHPVVDMLCNSVTKDHVFGSIQLIVRPKMADGVHGAVFPIAQDRVVAESKELRENVIIQGNQMK